jgi:hypothetical protein
MSFLVPCHACRRHVLATETLCPFCSAAVTPAMRVPRASPVRARVGRAAMLLLSSTAASSAVACGGDSGDSGSRQQPSEPAEPAASPSATEPGAKPDPAGTVASLPGTSDPNGANPVTTPDGEPMAVAEYGVAILPPTDPAPDNTMATTDPPAPDPNLVPRPMYGAPALPPTAPAAPGTAVTPPPVPGDPTPEPSTPAVEDAGAPIAATDAGAAIEDAGAAEPEPVPPPEPQPTVLPAYGVAILPVE